MLLTSSDTRRTLMHLFLFTERTGFNVYAEYTRPQLTFLALHPWSKVSEIVLYLFSNYKKKNETSSMSDYLEKKYPAKLCRYTRYFNSVISV